jgi:hypothetical protein
MNLPDAPIPQEGFFAAHFFTVSDHDKSKDSGPTPDKPEVLLQTSSDLNE